MGGFIGFQGLVGKNKKIEKKSRSWKVSLKEATKCIVEDFSYKKRVVYSARKLS